MSGKNCLKQSFFWILSAGLAAAVFLGSCNPNPYEEPVVPSVDNDKTEAISGLDASVYEVTYELWYNVRVWAEARGYTFANKGWEGGKNTFGAPPSGGGKNLPVTGITWRDAVVWCNAYSEREGYQPKYTYIDIQAALKWGKENKAYWGFFENAAEIERISYPAVGDRADNGYDGLEWECTNAGDSTANPAIPPVWAQTSDDILTTPHNDGEDINNNVDPGEDVYWYEYDFTEKVLKDATAIELCDRAQMDSSSDGFRLPTEPEWESLADSSYAGTEGDLKQAAWYKETAYPGNRSHIDYGVHSVGTKSANSKGLYDMSGNVWEWCWEEAPGEEYATDVYPTLPSPLDAPPVAYPALRHSQKSSDKPFFDPNNRVKKQRDSSVMKGGAWNSPAGDCEKGARKLGGRLRVGAEIGFRVVR